MATVLLCKSDNNLGLSWIILQDTEHDFYDGIPMPVTHVSVTSRALSPVLF